MSSFVTIEKFHAMEDSVRQHAEELARTYRELEQFRYISAHDLKEPLRMIRLYSEMLERHLDGELDDTGAKYLRFLTESSERMQALVTDLLTYSRVNRDFTPFKLVNWKRIVSSLRRRMKSQLTEMHAKLEIEGELPPIVGNERQLIQLLQQLTCNSLKFHGDIPPVVTVRHVPHQDRSVIAVEDNGIGIDPRYHKSIFTIFQRLHTQQVYPGTGVGLSICKRIVDYHGGEIWVESTIGKGSTFFVSFPLGERR